MSIPWWAEYSDDVLNPPVAKLSLADFKAWTLMKAVANQEEERGVLPPAPDLAYRIHMKEGPVGNILARLNTLGLVERRDDGRFVVARRKSMNNYPPPSTKRVQKHRTKKRDGNVSGNGDETGVKRFGNALEEEEERSPSGHLEGERYEESDVPSSSSRLDTEAEAEEDEMAIARRRLHEAGIGGGHSDGFRSMFDQSGLECVTHCIDEAVRHNKLSLAYVDSIRQRHVVDGCDAVGMTRRERMVESARRPR